LSSSSDEGDTISSLEDCKHLDWRMDREESLSDWTIEILVNGTVHGTYHVHKNILSVGSKQSLYFSRVFQNKKLKEHKTNTSRIEMEPLAADAFPVLLDYFYIWDDDPRITHENAAALHHLGNYLEISRLRIKVQQFWEEDDLTFAECAEYYEQATLFCDKKLISVVAQKCIAPVGDDSIILEQDSGCLDLIRVSNERLWLKALRKNDGLHNRLLSQLISLFVEHHHALNNLSVASFLKLTEEEWLPTIHWKAALRFLVVDHAMALSSKNGDNHEDIENSDDNDALSSLQERCIERIAFSWNELDSTSVTEKLRKLSPDILSEILTRSLKRCKKLIIPSSITVTGAGTEAVNGVYLRSEILFGDAPCFEKRGVWDGSPVDFGIYRVQSDKGGFFWKLWACPYPDNSFGVHGKIRFYRSVDKNGLKLPPISGWRCHSSDRAVGINPHPQLEYNYEQGD